jgi:folate-binding protein YgfZ
MSQHSTAIPGFQRDVYDSVRRGAGLLLRPHRGRILVSGPDRAAFLQGLLTNDIPALKPGTGCYAAYLTAQGRMITDLWVYELGDVILLSLSRRSKDSVLAKLDQMVFSEDVQLVDATETLSSAAVIGPDAARVVAAVIPGADAQTLAALPEHGQMRARFEPGSCLVLRITDTGEPGFEVVLETAALATFTDAVVAAGVPVVGDEVAEALRIEAGVPVFHQDMDEETIPLEAGIEARAISMTKGCYVGQEVIVRVLHRGHGRVARRLVGLIVSGPDVPPAGSTVQSSGREIGAITSSTNSPRVGGPIALAYLHRDFTAPGSSVQVADRAAAVSALPFAPGPA